MLLSSIQDHFLLSTGILPYLLAIAVLLPLLSFFTIFISGKWVGKSGAAIAIAAIMGAAILSYWSLGIWLTHHWPEGSSHAAHGDSHGDSHGDAHGDSEGDSHDQQHAQTAGTEHDKEEGGHTHPHPHSDTVEGDPKPAEAGVYYTLGQFGDLSLNISYYVDTLTICMFCMVTLIATLIHFYAMGYMHDEHHDVTDHEVTLEDGSHPTRPGRFPRFFQYLSLFCFSMLGLVLAGNIAMVFVFWELVGICSYFLIGFYVERPSASSAANKAFIVNRVGDFGMIIGLLAIWSGVGAFSFGDYTVKHDGHETEVQGLFTKLRNSSNDYQLITTYKDGDKEIATPNTPSGMVQLGAQEEVAKIVKEMTVAGKTDEEIEHAIAAHVPLWRDPQKFLKDLEHQPVDGEHAEHIAATKDQAKKLGGAHYGYLLLVIGGIGIFCGCVGKSAQFPLHVWLPDAMEGPTPVSALVHSATMVAAGVYLVGRFYPVFTPEVLLVIAIAGCITLLIGATIAITATDIKRVLAYSTVSQLGYMMLALGVGGWVAGLMHLITHAFFKSLLFMCSGSVIHAVHTNEMPQMGGLLKKMPITAITMLIGCLAIIGASIPFVIGTSGYYSKDAILETAFLYMKTNGGAWSGVFFCAAAGGAAITAFYMFRMWFMTFMGTPRDEHRYDHAHESPKVMWVPLAILAFFAITVAWSPFDTEFFGDWRHLSLRNLLEQARPAGTLGNTPGVLLALTVPDEHATHADFWGIVFPVTMLAFGTAIAGVSLAASLYWFKFIDPEDTRKQFAPIHRFLVNKWWFDELYDWVFVKPAFVIAKLVSAFDRNWIDRFIDGLAALTQRFAVIWEKIADQIAVDGFVNAFAGWTYAAGDKLRSVQTGHIRQYVMFIVLGAVSIFLLLQFF